MEAVISLLVLSALPQLVVPQVVTSFRAVAELVSQESRIFSGESMRLKCSDPSGHKSPWRFLWFKGSEQLPQTGAYLVLWNTKDRDSGKYYCQGVRDSMIGEIHTLRSLPVEITVDGGWAILKVPPYPSLAGHTLSITCMVRGEPQLKELILYKDGLEVMRQTGPDPTFHLPNLTLQDTGMYSCRASWDVHRRTRSVISAEAQVQVLEVLSQPVLEINTENNGIPGKMKLICHLQYNAPAPAPPLHYYFYKGDDKLATAMSENHLKVTRTPGQYRCRAKVPELGLARWSEPQTFGQVTGPKTTMPPILHPRVPWLLAPTNSSPNSSPDSSLPPVAESSTAEPIPELSATSTLEQPTDVSSNPLLSLSQSTQETLSSTVLPIQQTPITIPIDIYEELGEMSEESKDKAEGSEDMPEGFGDMVSESGSGDIAKGSEDTLDWSEDLPEGSGDMAEGSGDMARGSWGMVQGSWDMVESSGDMTEESGGMVEGFWDMAEGPEDMTEGSWDMVESSGDIVEGSGGMVEGFWDMAEGPEDMTEGSGDMVESSGDLVEGSGGMVEGFWDMAEGPEDLTEGSGDMTEGSGDIFMGSDEML